MVSHDLDIASRVGAVPKTVLLQYQKDWINDKSPLKLWVKARQIGWSFTGTLEPALECVTRKTLWIFLSTGQRQSIELAHKAKAHLDAMRAIEMAARGTVMSNERWGLVDGVEITQTTIDIPFTQARMIFLPANPDTARGYSGNVMADEFAFHKQAKKIYAAMYPSITRGYKMHIGSSPFGESGIFCDLATKKSGYSVHTTDIFRAVDDGLARDTPYSDAEFIQRLRDGCPDEDIWEQEYCCKFISDATSYIPWDLIIDAESDLASMELPLYWTPQGRLWLGGDIGRHKDLTVFILLEQIGDVFYVRMIARLVRKPFAEQREFVRLLMRRYRIERYCQDSTGLGMQMAEELVSEFGSSRVEGVTFNVAVKEDLAVRTRRVYEDKRLRAPSERAFRSAIHAVRRITTTGGHFRFDADRTDAGHADEFWALALALLAADGKPVTLGITTSSAPTSFSQVGGFL